MHFYHFKGRYLDIENVANAEPAEKQETGNKKYKFELMDNDIVRTERSQIPPSLSVAFCKPLSSESTLEVGMLVCFNSDFKTGKV